MAIPLRPCAIPKGNRKAREMLTGSLGDALKRVIMAAGYAI